jgi:hypothetical protein
MCRRSGHETFERALRQQAGHLSRLADKIRTGDAAPASARQIDVAFPELDIGARSPDREDAARQRLGGVCQVQM